MHNMQTKKINMYTTTDLITGLLKRWYPSSQDERLFISEFEINSNILILTRSVRAGFDPGANQSYFTHTSVHSTTTAGFLGYPTLQLYGVLVL